MPILILTFVFTLTQAPKFMELRVSLALGRRLGALQSGLRVKCCWCVSNSALGISTKEGRQQIPIYLHRSEFHLNRIIHKKRSRSRLKKFKKRLFETGNGKRSSSAGTPATTTPYSYKKHRPTIHTLHILRSPPGHFTRPLPTSPPPLFFGQKATPSHHSSHRAIQSIRARCRTITWEVLSAAQVRRVYVLQPPKIQVGNNGSNNAQVVDKACLPPDIRIKARRRMLWRQTR